MNSLSQRFEVHLTQQKFIRLRDKIFIACSGGPDSTALFYLLLGLQKKYKLKLGLLHVHHGLRGREANGDAQFVKAMAKQFSVPFFMTKKQILKKARQNRESVEEAARYARYDFFEKIAKLRRIPKIVFAHTQDDQAETVLMRIIQGTGLRGLCGIRSKLKNGKVTYIRPLLPFTKKEVLEYLKINRISFRKDSSNRSKRFLRNRIRIDLIPQLKKEYNPRLVQSLARLPSIAAEENDLLEALEKAAWKDSYRGKHRGRLFFERKTFLGFPAPIQFRILHRALQMLDPKSGLSFDAWQSLRPSISRSQYRHSLPRDIDLSLTPLKIIIYRKSVKL